jgi:hypothetical protein
VGGAEGGRASAKAAWETEDGRGRAGGHSGLMVARGGRPGVGRSGGWEDGGGRRRAEAHRRGTRLGALISSPDRCEGLLLEKKKHALVKIVQNLS